MQNLGKYVRLEQSMADEKSIKTVTSIIEEYARIFVITIASTESHQMKTASAMQSESLGNVLLIGCIKRC